MKIDIIKKCPIFADIKDSQLETLLNCLTAVTRAYLKDGFVFMAENKASSVGIVLTGGVYIIQEDFWGNRTIIAHIKPVGMFGEAFSCAGTDKLPVSVVAAEDVEVLLIDYRKVVTSCSSACVFHTQLIKNMLSVIADKNIMLTHKIEHLSKRTIREKILSFLSTQAVQTKSSVVKIPFNRQELADYLCVDRSALSRELGLMQNEGLLHYEKNRFKLLRDDRQ